MKKMIKQKERSKRKGNKNKIKGMIKIKEGKDQDERKEIEMKKWKNGSERKR